jgi:hypothetical protein
MIIQCGICELVGETGEINESLGWGSGMVNHQHVWICPDCFENRYGYRPKKFDILKIKEEK